MVNPSINSFLFNLDKHNGPAKSDRFFVQITPPSNISGPERDISFQCDLAEIPGVSVEAVRYRFYGPERNMALSTIFNEIIIEIICTNEFVEKPFFDAWVNLINPREQGWDLNYKDVYTGTVTIFQVDQQSNVVYTVNLVNAWPSHVAPMPTRWADDAFHKLSVTFLYDRYDTEALTTNLINGFTNPFIG